MAYDESLAARVRECLAGTRETGEKKMFGGLCFLHRGHMCVGVVGDELMVRVGPEAYAATLKLAHAREMDFTGRPLEGMVYVGVAGLRGKRALSAWVERGLAFTATLPEKAAAKKSTAKKSTAKKSTAKKKLAKKGGDG